MGKWLNTQPSDQLLGEGSHKTHGGPEGTSSTLSDCMFAFAETPRLQPSCPNPRKHICGGDDPHAPSLWHVQFLATRGNNLELLFLLCLSGDNVSSSASHVTRSCRRARKSCLALEVRGSREGNCMMMESSGRQESAEMSGIGHGLTKAEFL